jgi:hypothetical protein
MEWELNTSNIPYHFSPIIGDYPFLVFRKFKVSVVSVRLSGVAGLKVLLVRA